MPRGSLVVVGVGIKVVGHVTLEAQAFIQHAEKVLYLVANDPIIEWIRRLNPTAESLHDYYADDKLRIETYYEIIDHILDLVRQGLQLCVVYYGHPGVFVTSAHVAVRRARQEGFLAWMLPGISAEDCLFADLALDPANHGVQSFEATAFLLQKRQADVTSNLILWQVGTVGVLHYHIHMQIANGLRVLTEYLMEFYDSDHEIVLYEASVYPSFPPLIQRLPLAQLPMTPVSRMATLYLPPKVRAPFDPTMIERLGITPTDLSWKPDKSRPITQ